MLRDPSGLGLLMDWIYNYLTKIELLDGTIMGKSILIFCIAPVFSDMITKNGENVLVLIIILVPNVKL